MTASDDEFGRIFAAYRAPLERFAARRFGQCDAEDIAQETLTRCYEWFDRLDRTHDVWPWLTHVALRVGVDVTRAHGRAAPLPVDAIEPLVPPVPEVPLGHVIAAERRHTMLRAWGRLQPRDRLVLRLRHLDEVSVGEIAARIHCNANATRQALARARRHLRQEWRSVGGDRLDLALAPAAVPGQSVWSGVRRMVGSLFQRRPELLPLAGGVVTGVAGLLAVVPPVDVPRPVAAPPPAATVVGQPPSTPAPRPSSPADPMGRVLGRLVPVPTKSTMTVAVGPYPAPPPRLPSPAPTLRVGALGVYVSVSTDVCETDRTVYRDDERGMQVRSCAVRTVRPAGDPLRPPQSR